MFSVDGVAVVFAVLNQLELAALFVFIGILFDFLDGLVARMLNVQSDLGLQLDFIGRYDHKRTRARDCNVSIAEYVHNQEDGTSILLRAFLRR